MAESTSPRIVVIGGSAGSLEPLLGIFRRLPADIDASFFVVQHISPDSRQYLPDLITSAGPIPAHRARDNEAIVRGNAYVAPPDYHLMVRDGVMVLSHGPHENRTRPAIDPLFRSAAVEHRGNVIAVLLSGMLDDGAAGMAAIGRCGGTTIVQDPDDAAFPDMPSSALAAVDVDHSVRADEIAALIETLVRQPVSALREVPEELRLEVAITRDASGTSEKEDDLGQRSAQSCPECGGPMWQMDDPHLPRYRCTVGHSFTGRVLLTEQGRSIERALWAAVRTLEERRRLLEQLLSDAERRGHERIANGYRRRRDETVGYVEELRRLVTGRI